ncbi:hypothetical protein L210DRAFT_650471 [Boletus edulis BED1]|uniref:Uncharacterized protein n=1 Tax=Boletus edulis BED1 TaxID=1328754 RepID=A0AAD4C0Y1_BOLED|nr:hypothetical protein L210DRAFT_650471 [Boletus edulis BED1]
MISPVLRRRAIFRSFGACLVSCFWRFCGLVGHLHHLLTLFFSQALLPRMHWISRKNQNQSIAHRCRVDSMPMGYVQISTQDRPDSIDNRFRHHGRPPHVQGDNATCRRETRRRRTCISKRCIERILLLARVEALMAVFYRQRRSSCGPGPDASFRHNVSRFLGQGKSGSDSCENTVNRKRHGRDMTRASQANGNR